MKFLTVLFYDDGRYAGTQGSERLLPDDWQPPLYMNPGEDVPRRFLAVHVGAAELTGTAACISTELSQAIEPDPLSAPQAPRFRVKGGKTLPALVDVPCKRGALEAWVRARGPEAMPKQLRAWLTLTEPELAETYRLDRGIDLADMIEVERKRLGTIRPEHSRLEDLERRVQRRDQAKRAAIFDRQARAMNERAIARRHLEHAAASLKSRQAKQEDDAS